MGVGGIGPGAPPQTTDAPPITVKNPDGTTREVPPGPYNTDPNFLSTSPWGLGPSDADLKKAAFDAQQNNENINAVVQAKLGPNETYDPKAPMNPQAEFEVGRQIGMNNWKDAEAALKRYFPDGTLYSIGGTPAQGDTDTFIYQTSPRSTMATP